MVCATEKKNMPNPKSLQQASKTALTINTKLGNEVENDGDDSENDQVRKNRRYTLAPTRKYDAAQTPARGCSLALFAPSTPAGLRKKLLPVTPPHQTISSVV